jgi:hypothetical protein
MLNFQRFRRDNSRPLPTVLLFLLLLSLIIIAVGVGLLAAWEMSKSPLKTQEPLKLTLSTHSSQSDTNPIPPAQGSDLISNLYLICQTKLSQEFDLKKGLVLGLRKTPYLSLSPQEPSQIPQILTLPFLQSLETKTLYWKLSPGPHCVIVSQSF